MPLMYALVIASVRGLLHLKGLVPPAWANRLPPTARQIAVEMEKSAFVLRLDAVAVLSRGGSSWRFGARVRSAWQ